MTSAAEPHLRRTSPRLVTHTCSRCGDSYKGDEVPALGERKFNPNGSRSRRSSTATPANQKSRGAFPDTDKVGDFAGDALIWATNEKLINGVSSGGVTRLAPRDSATRAQIAAIIMRYLG